MIAAQRYQHDVDDIRRRLDCRDIARDYWGEPVYRTANMSRYNADVLPGRKHETSPSLDATKQRLYDSAGGQSWDCFGLFGLLHNTDDFKEQLKHAIAYLGGAPLTVLPRVAPKPQLEALPDPNWQKAARAFVERSEGLLWSPEGKRALDYLRNERGLTDETIKAAHLGYNPDWSLIGVMIDGKPVKMPRGIIIPVFVGDELRAVQCRKPLPPGSDENKYHTMTGSKVAGTVYGLDRLAPGKTGVVVESVFDAKIIDQVLGPDFVGLALISANAKLSVKHADIIRQTGKTPIAAMDGDQAGQKGNAGLLQVFGAVRVLPLPEGQDITDFVKAGGDLPALITQAELQTAPQLQWLTDPMLHAARLAGFGAVYALVGEFVKTRGKTHFTVYELCEFGAEIGYNLNRRTASHELKNGLNLAWYCRWQESVNDILQERKEDQDILKEEPTEFCQRDRSAPKVYEILPAEVARQNILALARFRIYERYLPQDKAAAIIAPFTDDELARVGYLKPIADQLNAAIDAELSTDQPRYERARANAARMFKRLRRAVREDTTYTPIRPGWVCKTAKDILAHQYRVLVESEPDRAHSQNELTARLFCAKSTLPTLRKRAGIENVAQFSEPIRVTSAAQAEALGFEMRGKAAVIHTPEAPGQREVNTTYEAPELERQLAENGAAFVKFRLPSLQKVVTEGQPEQAPTKGQGETALDTERPTRKRGDKFPLPVQVPDELEPIGADPVWVATRLFNAFARKFGDLGFRDRSIINRKTGEIVLHDGTLGDLIELLANGLPPDEPPKPPPAATPKPPDGRALYLNWSILRRLDRGKADEFYQGMTPPEREAFRQYRRAYGRNDECTNS